ncbi:Hypothetical predicted protein [Olea europaea subsp. europaea]|uniref:Uncharacterized protein n=1 Tax=Olea europaea subsp. europaea TaxID=158383 RepID=A0A8S0TJT5_OLEEU|nr:Hypothetical predicted protein [Olea europaea subsp. europaea]
MILETSRAFTSLVKNSTRPKTSLKSENTYGSVKVKQLAALLIPRFFNYFPGLLEQALDQHLYLCEDEELGEITWNVKRCIKPSYLYYGRMLKLFSMSAAASLIALFRHIGSTEDRSADEISTWETIRKKVLCFIRDKVFLSLKGELLKPLGEMARHLTNLIKQNLQDV